MTAEMRVGHKFLIDNRRYTVRLMDDGHDCTDCGFYNKNLSYACVAPPNLRCTSDKRQDGQNVYFEPSEKHNKYHY